MKEIENRDDVHLLVSTLYEDIREDDLLGPIFNGHIEDKQWPAHLEKLTDFWMTNLFGIACFKGNPSKAHKNVDKNMGYSINPTHFGQWVNLWINTVDNLFEGNLAERAKHAARKMATGQYLAIWKHRPSQNN